MRNWKEKNENAYGTLKILSQLAVATLTRKLCPVIPAVSYPWDISMWWMEAINCSLDTAEPSWNWNSGPMSDSGWLQLGRSLDLFSPDKWWHLCQMGQLSTIAAWLWGTKCLRVSEQPHLRDLNADTDRHVNKQNLHCLRSDRMPRVVRTACLWRRMNSPQHMMQLLMKNLVKKAVRYLFVIDYNKDQRETLKVELTHLPLNKTGETRLDGGDIT